MTEHITDEQVYDDKPLVISDKGLSATGRIKLAREAPEAPVIGGAAEAARRCLARVAHRRPKR